jgi:hypothetical protein
MGPECGLALQVPVPDARLTKKSVDASGWAPCSNPLRYGLNHRLAPAQMAPPKLGGRVRAMATYWIRPCLTTAE